MNRRDFLKVSGAGVAALSVPLSVGANGPREKRSVEPTTGAKFVFNPKHSYANAVLISAPVDQRELDLAKSHLERDMKRYIPSGYRHAVRYIVQEDYYVASVAWKYSPGNL